DVYVAKTDDLTLGSYGLTYDLCPAPALMKLELQYGLQCRHDARKGQWQSRWLKPIPRAVAGYSERASFADTEPEAFLGIQSRRAWRYVATVVSGVFDDSDPWERDVWDLRKFGIDPKGTQTRLYFTRIPQHWLRNIAKSCLTYQMSRGLAARQLGTYCQAMCDLASWLAQHYPSIQSPEQVTRAAVEGFVIHVRANQRPGTGKHKLLALKAILEDAGQHEWANFKGRLYDSNIPRAAELKPKAIDEFVMRQLEAPSALEHIEQPDYRAIIELLMLCGMRISECCELSFNPISFDSAGAPVLATHITKTGDAENLCPVSDRVLHIVQEQQQRVLARFGYETPCLFPRHFANQDGELPTSPDVARAKVERWLANVKVTDRSGQPVRVTPHQFRHTLGTRMVNQGIPLTVIKRMLGHKDMRMTEHYARLNDQTMRREFERFSASRVNIRGELLHPHCSDVEWTKERLGRALVTTQNGYCGRPLQLDCPHPNACLTCPDFLTDVSFLDGHRRQLAETKRLITAAELAGNTRVLEMNRKVATNLETIITSLQGCAGPRVPNVES
ncbi:MAG: tyrosine-type recombinase/integrase, partial [Chloroflexota bacterium]